MLFFAATFSTILLLVSLATSVPMQPSVRSFDAGENCIGGKKSCTLFMGWETESFYPLRNMDQPKDLEVYVKNCVIIPSWMNQPEPHGPITITSPEKLAHALVVNGNDTLGRPMITYGGTEVQTEHCGTKDRGDGYLGYSCAFDC